MYKKKKKKKKQPRALIATDLNLNFDFNMSFNRMPLLSLYFVYNEIRSTAPDWCYKNKHLTKDNK